jgi:hypothetical protein
MRGMAIGIETQPEFAVLRDPVGNVPDGSVAVPTEVHIIG